MMNDWSEDPSFRETGGVAPRLVETRSSAFKSQRPHCFSRSDSLELEGRPRGHDVDAVLEPRLLRDLRHPDRRLPERLPRKVERSIVDREEGLRLQPPHRPARVLGTHAVGPKP